MTVVDEGFRLEDDGTEPEERDEDCLESRMRILRDVMLSYDWSFLGDVRDRMYVGRLEEALGFLGMRLDARVSVEGLPDGGFAATATVEVGYGEESTRFTSASESPDRTGAVLVSALAAFRAAGLVGTPRPLEGGGLRLALGVR